MEYPQNFFTGKKVFSFFVCFFALAVFAVLAKQTLALSMPPVNGQAKVLGDSALNLYPYPTASLVKDGGTIYFISGITKIPFANYKAFTGLGYSLHNVVTGDLSNYELQTYIISTANTSHPWDSWVSYKGAVYYFTSDGMIGVPSADVFLSNGGKWNLVVKANKYDIFIINTNSALAVLTSGDARVSSQPTFQFGGQPVTQNSSSSQNPESPAATVTPLSIIPQIILPTNIYASSSAVYTVLSGATNTPLVYNFFWDDGTPANSLSVNSATHTYFIPGTYVLEVTVIDSLNNSNTSTTPVTVVMPPTQTPTAPALTLPHGVIVGAEATATATASDPQNLPLAYTFSWGDGTADTLATANSATHIYSSSASFIVKVTATNGLGFSNFSQDYIYVAP